MIRLLLAQAALKLIDKMLGKEDGGDDAAALPAPSMLDMLPARIVGEATPQEDGTWVCVVRCGDLKVADGASDRVEAIRKLTLLVEGQSKFVRQ